MKRILENFNKIKDGRNGDVVTFDFDQTVVKSFLNQTDDGQEIYQYGGVNKEIIKRIKAFKKAGKMVFIVTSRDNHLEEGESSVRTLLDKLKIDVDGIFYTNGEPKAQKLYELGSTLHFDDDPEEHDAIKAYKNLHKNFNIAVKYPDDLIKDIPAVAKGVIITADGKILVAQRSDSEEWDAPGGHIMQGEEPNYSFWREVKEELALKVTAVEFLDKTETTWNGETKDTFYFIGRTKYASDNIEGAMILQWEIKDWFCGDWEQVQRETKGNQTQHLASVMNILQGQQATLGSGGISSEIQEIKKRTIVGLDNLMERDYQRQSSAIKSYNKDANELTSTGPNTGGSPFKNVKMKRGKSAPPGAPGGGWGPSLEEGEEKKPTKTYKIKITKTINEKKRKKRKKKNKSYWPYNGFVIDSGTNPDGSSGGDGGGGE